ncbi:hypothetical protein AZOA_26990 [Azoarcus sp. Aa7]|nr:hypothetical protein [Azoarcus sp. Aa7]
MRGQIGVFRADARAFGDADLRLDDVHAGDLLGDGVFDLDPGVHFDEVEGTGVGVHEELDRAGVGVICGAAEFQRGIAQLRAASLLQVGRGGAFDDLLVAPLHRAVALEEMHEVAVRVAEHLHFDVARAANELFQIDLVVAEGGEGLAAGDVEQAGELFLVLDRAHAATATAPARLEHERVADFAREAFDLVEVLRQCAGGRHDRHAGGDGEVARGDLVAQIAHHLRLRADEGDAGGGAGFGELGVLGEEAVAGVDRIDPGILRHTDDVGDVEVGRDRLLAVAHEVGFVGLEAVQREAVLVGVDRHRADAQFARRAEDADGDFATVGDEDAADFSHRGCVGSGFRKEVRPPAAAGRGLGRRIRRTCVRS